MQSFPLSQDLMFLWHGLLNIQVFWDVLLCHRASLGFGGGLVPAQTWRIYRFYFHLETRHPAGSTLMWLWRWDSILWLLHVHPPLNHTPSNSYICSSCGTLRTVFFVHCGIWTQVRPSEDIGQMGGPTKNASRLQDESIYRDRIMDAGCIYGSELRHMGTPTYEYSCNWSFIFWHMSVDWKPIC